VAKPGEYTAVVYMTYKKELIGRKIVATLRPVK